MTWSTAALRAEIAGEFSPYLAMWSARRRAHAAEQRSGSYWRDPVASRAAARAYYRITHAVRLEQKREGDRRNRPARRATEKRRKRRIDQELRAQRRAVAAARAAALDALARSLGATPLARRGA